MRLGIATLTAFVAVVAAAVAADPAHASTPIPWCGTGSSAIDRAPDVAAGFSVHVAYVRAPGTADRFAELAPRIVGDIAAFDAWWQREDPTRTPRFDLFPAPGCASAFGGLDITSLQVPLGLTGIDGAFQLLRQQLATAGLTEPEKAYLVYYDGATGQSGNERVCGQGARPPTTAIPGLAIVYLDSCSAATDDTLRPVVAIHELLHVLGSVSGAAPSSCQGGHVCDFPLDLMTAFVTGEPLEMHVLDFGRNDYYGHTGTWTDVQESTFLERLDSPDRTPPTLPQSLRVASGPSGFVRFSWLPSTDDVGPASYRVYQDGRFFREVTATSLLLPDPGATGSYSVRAADRVGRLSPVTTALFRPGFGMVDEQGRLVRDTVRPATIQRITVKRGVKAVVISWPAVRDGGGLLGYRVKIGARTLTVRKPMVTISRSRLTGPVSIAAVDRAGNVSSALVVSGARLR